MIHELALLQAALGHDGSLCLLVLLTGLGLAWAATPVARWLALHHGATDAPGGRRAHQRVTPRMGGLAVLTAIVGATLVGTPSCCDQVIDRAAAYAQVLPILLIAAMVCLFGALDDLTPISPLGKVTGLATAGLLLGLSGVTIDQVSLPWVGPLALGAFALPATVLWVLACTNAVNLIDGIDGSCPGVVTIAACVLMLLSLGLGDTTSAVLFAATCGGAGGFLIHNRQPASIFLGDSGSLLLGFVLAATSAASCGNAATSLTLVATLLALAVPFLDASQSFVRRFRASLRLRPAAVIPALRATAIADLGHIHHRLLRCGLSHRNAARRICLVTLLTSLSALLLLPTGQVHWAALGATLATGLSVTARLGWIREPAEPAGETPPPLPRPPRQHTGESSAVFRPQGHGRPHHPTARPSHTAPGT